jgi:hypothetical protein
MALAKPDLLNKHGRWVTLQRKTTTNNNDFRIHCITDSVQELTDVPLWSKVHSVETLKFCIFCISCSQYMMCDACCSKQTYKSLCAFIQPFKPQYAQQLYKNTNEALITSSHDVSAIQEWAFSAQRDWQTDIWCTRSAAAPGSCWQVPGTVTEDSLDRM